MKYNKDLSGIAIADELIRRTSSASLRLARDTIVSSSVVVRTAPAGGGTLLALTTDYTLGGQDARLTTEAGTDIFTTLAIVNGAYHNTDLYVTYSTVGDFAEAEDINELSGSVTVAGNYSVQSEHTVNVNANSATITIPAGLRIGRRITVRKLGTVETTSVDIARSGSEVFTSASLASLPIFGNGGNWIIEKVTATRWEIVGGRDSVKTSNDSWERRPNGRMIQCGQRASGTVTWLGSSPRFYHITTGTLPMSFSSLTGASLQVSKIDGQLASRGAYISTSQLTAINEFNCAIIATINTVTNAYTVEFYAEANWY